MEQTSKSELQTEPAAVREAENAEAGTVGKRARYGIKGQLFLIVFFSIAVCVALALLVNTFFLSHVYLRYRVDNMKKAFFVLDEEAVDGTLYDTDNTEFEKICSENNVDILVMSSAGIPLITSEQGKERMLLRFYGILFEGADVEKDIIYSGSNFSVERNHDDRLDKEDLVLWGTLSDGNLILMETAIGPINQAAKLSNIFLLVTGLFSMVASIIMAGFLGRRITKPVLELTELSKRMAALDFNARYAPHRRMNEVDELGVNMNSMSETLEKTIIELKQANNDLKHDLTVIQNNETRRKEFLSNVSHELKTPIALIQGYAEGLTDGISDSPEDRQFYCDVITDEAKKMGRLVSELMSLDQLEGGVNQLTMERFDISNMISAEISKNRLLFEDGGITVNFSPSPVYVIADSFYTEQVLQNYISNAIHYVKGDPKQISVTAEPKEDCVRISVMNTGDPIPDEAVGHLFEKFYKVDKARTREYGGSGIGLSVVKAIMDLHHHAYGETNLPDGVVFWFELDKG